MLISDNGLELGINRTEVKDVTSSN